MEKFFPTNDACPMKQFSKRAPSVIFAPEDTMKLLAITFSPTKAGSFSLLLILPLVSFETPLSIAKLPIFVFFIMPQFVIVTFLPIVPIVELILSEYDFMIFSIDF